MYVSRRKLTVKLVPLFPASTLHEGHGKSVHEGAPGSERSTGIESIRLLMNLHGDTNMPVGCLHQKFSILVMTDENTKHLTSNMRLTSCT